MDAKRLVRIFTLRSVPLVLVLALALGFVLTSGLSRVFLAEASRRADSTVSSLVRHHLADLDLVANAPATTWGDLDELVRGDLAGSDIYALRVWNRDGNVVYASFNGPEVIRPDETDMAVVIAGEHVRRVEREARDWPDAGVEDGDRFILVLAPLVADGGRVLGVLEIRQSYAPVAANVWRAHGWVWGVILLCVVPAYFVQVRIVRGAAEQLGRTQEAVVDLDARLVESMEDLEKHSLGTLQALNAAVDAKDSYTARHSLAVTDCAGVIGRRLGLSEDDLRTLERAGLLHDLGKIGIPERVLLKPERLSAEEYDVIKTHADVGAGILQSIPFLHDAVEIVLHHHECWDGSGYPEGLSGESIPLLARILAVADAFDAMTSDRPYRHALALEEACAELHVMRDIQFDPRIVDALLEAADGGELTVSATAPTEHSVTVGAA